MKAYKALGLFLIAMISFTACTAKNEESSSINTTEEKFSQFECKDNTAYADKQLGENVEPPLIDTTEEKNFQFECEDDIVYTDEQLKEIVDFEGTKIELFKLYPTPYAVEYEATSRLVYYSDTSAASICFDQNGVREKAFFEMFNISVPKKEFEVIKKGDSLDSVRALDPVGEYRTCFPSGIDTRVSIHHTSDKFIIWIYYETDLSVKDIVVESLM